MEKLNSDGSVVRDGREVFAVVEGKNLKVGTVRLGQFVPGGDASLFGSHADLVKHQARAQLAFSAGRVRGLMGFLRRAF